MNAEIYSQLNRQMDKPNQSERDETYRLSFIIRAKIMGVYFTSLFLSYTLMLIVMTFNAGLFVATVVGLTSGYFVFGFTRKRGYTKIYCPETDKCCT